MPKPTASVPPNTKPAPEAKTPRELLIEYMAAHLDPDYPSVIVQDNGGAIGDGAEYGAEGKGKPDFVRADDEQFNCNQ